VPSGNNRTIILCALQSSESTGRRKLESNRERGKQCNGRDVTTDAKYHTVNSASKVKKYKFRKSLVTRAYRCAAAARVSRPRNHPPQRRNPYSPLPVTTPLSLHPRIRERSGGEGAPVSGEYRATTN